MRLFGIGVAVIALVALIAGLADPARGGDKKKKPHLDPQGEPKGFKAGESVRYAVWHGKNHWRLRTTTAKKEHVFKGGIVIEGGAIDKIHSHHLEKEGKLQDHWKLSADRTAVYFDFRTDKGIDGIDFTVTPGAKAIRFSLSIDGKNTPNRIFIGHEGHHPTSDPFAFPAHPNRKEKKKKGCGEEEE